MIGDRFDLYQARFEDILPTLPDHSIDLILCDLPFGQTRHGWDTTTPLGFLKVQYDRLIKDDGVILLHAMQPFTTDLINLMRPWFRQELIWDKVISTGYLDAKRKPMRRHESILVFSRSGYPKYYAIKTKATKKATRKTRPASGNCLAYGGHVHTATYDDGSRYPTTIMRFSNAERMSRFHPTQKPVPLLEHLIKLFSHENDLVLDNAMGSGSTGVAAISLGRRFIGVERDEKYFEIAGRRITEAMEKQPALSEAI